MKTQVLDHGFVELLNLSGPVRRLYQDTPDDANLPRRFDASDIDPAMTARISFDNLDEKRSYAEDMRLVDYLMRNYHTTPIEMIESWWHMKMPIFIARHFVRHRTATINEVSARYAILPAEWYIPATVGGKAEFKKQGQEDNLHLETQRSFKRQLDANCRRSYADYKQFLDLGVAPEHARMFLHVNHYCVQVDTPILKQDLSWVRAGDLKRGDKLLAFEEYGKDSKSKRRLLPAEVTAFSIKQDELYKIELSNGDSLTCNKEHKWLVRYKSGGGSRWVSTKELMLNPTQWVIPKLFDVWDEQKAYDWGFLAAAFDGEGYLTYTTHNGKALGFTQNENPLLAKVRRLLTQEGYYWTEQSNIKSGTKNLRLGGGLGTILEFLGKARPPRLLSKWLNDTDGGIWAKDMPEIVKIIPIGLGEIASMSTSSKTYIANGYPSHNTHWIWKQDLHNLMHFLALRLDKHAQIEAQAFANAMHQQIREVLPGLMDLFDKYRRFDAAKSENLIPATDWVRNWKIIFFDKDKKQLSNSPIIAGSLTEAERAAINICETHHNYAFYKFEPVTNQP